MYVCLSEVMAHFFQEKVNNKLRFIYLDKWTYYCQAQNPSQAELALLSLLLQTGWPSTRREKFKE